MNASTPASSASRKPLARHCVSGDGVHLAAWEWPDNGPAVVFVHGFPDTHEVWLPVIARLSDRFHCLAYDVRGAGASSRPPTQDGYAVRHLVDDLVAVLDTLTPERPVHLVGHDWGSVQAWEAVIREKSDPRLTGRIASYTTISGPCLAHLGAFAKAARRGDWRRKGQGLRQALHSWYVFAFQVPVLPELVLRRVTRGIQATRRTHGGWHFGATLTDDAAHGVSLYRANFRHHERAPGGARTTVPVQLVVPLRDRYLTPVVYQDLPRFVSDLTRVDIDAGHWVQQTHPGLVADLVADFATSHGKA